MRTWRKPSGNLAETQRKPCTLKQILRQILRQIPRQLLRQRLREKLGEKFDSARAASTRTRSASASRTVVGGRFNLRTDGTKPTVNHGSKERLRNSTKFPGQANILANIERNETDCCSDICPDNSPQNIIADRQVLAPTTQFYSKYTHCPTCETIRQSFPTLLPQCSHNVPTMFGHCSHITPSLPQSISPINVPQSCHTKSTVRWTSDRIFTE